MPASSSPAQHGAPGDRQRASAATATQIEAFRAFITLSFVPVVRDLRAFVLSKAGQVQSGEAGSLLNSPRKGRGEVRTSEADSKISTRPQWIAAYMIFS